MRQDKDRSAKWMLTHHGDAILKLAGMTGFTKWQALQPETVAPRRLPDGLLEVQFANRTKPTLVLVEIETYPDSDADTQVFEDLMLIAVDRKTVPEVVSFVLKPKGHLTVNGSDQRVSESGQTRISGSWPVVKLWELEADQLLNAGDVGLVPWVPLTKTKQSPEELLTRCRDQLVQVANANDRAGLMAVTQILANLAFPDKRFLDLFGGPDAMIESPLLDEVKEMLRQRYKADGVRMAVLGTLEARFGSVPAERVVALGAVADETRLRELVRLAATCPNLDAFVSALAGEG